MLQYSVQPLREKAAKGDTDRNRGLWRSPVQCWPVPQSTKTDLYDLVTCGEVRGGLQSLCPLEKERIHISEHDFPLPVTVEDAVSGKRSPTHAGALSDGRASTETAPGNSGQVHTEGLCNGEGCSHTSIPTQMRLLVCITHLFWAIRGSGP